MSPRDGRAWRLGLPANAGRGGWAGGTALAGRSGAGVGVVSRRGAPARCSGAGGAMLEVDPLPSALPALRVDPPPLAPHHQPHERWPSLPCG